MRKKGLKCFLISDYADFYIPDNFYHAFVISYLPEGLQKQKGFETFSAVSWRLELWHCERRFHCLCWRESLVQKKKAPSQPNGPDGLHLHHNLSKALKAVFSSCHIVPSRLLGLIHNRKSWLFFFVTLRSLCFSACNYPPEFIEWSKGFSNNRLHGVVAN